MTDIEIIRAGGIFSTQQPQRSLGEVDSKARILEVQATIKRGGGWHVPDGEPGSPASGATRNRPPVSSLDLDRVRKVSRGIQN